MTDDRTLRAIPRVAELIANADALLITAGAGMGVDSGLPDFRGKDGFWRAYPALGKRGISFEQMAQPSWFFEEPETAWAFYGHRQQLYRDTKPHAGFGVLREWGRVMPGEYFVVTSNVDGHFQYAGYPGHRIVEQHGNVHRYQCADPCSRMVWHYEPPNGWNDQPPDLKFDLTKFTAEGQLPRCPACGGMARPNVMMFGDAAWVGDVAKVQQARYADWLASVRGKRLVVIELGAGNAIPTIRRIGEDLVERGLATLVRINTESNDSDEPAMPLRLPALEALTRIDAALPEGFRERCREAVSESPTLPMFDEAAERLPSGRVRFVSRDLTSLKQGRMLADAWQIALPGGGKAWVEQIDVHRNYLDFLLGGIPNKNHVTTVIESAKAFVRESLYGPEPVVIPPKLFDASSDAPILPPLRFVARIRSWDKVNDDDEGSWMNLIWFAEIDDDKSIKAFVEEALAQVDWKKLASGYSI
jgi:NAD-dependent SIR2 family protein deacetylase